MVNLLKRSLLVVLAAAPFCAAVFGVAQEAQPAPEEFQAITYFEDRCARCHGAYGGNYDTAHMAQSSDEKLRQVIRDMAEGPGQAPLDDRQLDAETAFHRSLLDGKPFVSFNAMMRSDEKTILSGEVTPEATVQIRLDQTTIAATVDEHTWQATLPANFDVAHAFVVAAKGDAKTELSLMQPHSHAGK